MQNKNMSFFNFAFLKLGAFYRLVRFEHAIMFSIAVLIGEIVALGSFPTLSLPIILSLLIPILSEMGAFALNDILDVEADKINKRTDRPLVSGEISQQSAYVIVVVSFILAFILSFFVNELIFLITLFLILASIIYNYYLKDLPLIGNAYIAFTMGIPFIFGNLVVSNSLHQINIILAFLGFIVGLGREIAKSVEDMEGDLAARKSKTLPMIIGAEKSLTLSGIFYTLFVMFSIIPFYFFLPLGIGFVLVLIADIFIIYCALIMIFSSEKIPFLKTSRKISLIALFIALIGILASVLKF